mmetsp:Transcript_99040/g.181629  ORF Transcript_99040/g.181629 Transcript_99040/m.181629 type:complete len:90 (-) Transcript_99040:1460-1729(-)
MRLKSWKVMEADEKKTDTHFSEDDEFRKTSTKMGASEAVVMTKTHWKKRMLLIFVGTSSLLKTPEDCKSEKHIRAIPRPRSPLSVSSSQ